MTIVAVCFNSMPVFESPHDKTNKMLCAPSEDLDQSGHPPSLIRVFAVRMQKAWVLSYPLSAQRRLWLDWADAQADLSLRWAHMPFLLVFSWGGSFTGFMCSCIIQVLQRCHAVLQEVPAGLRQKRPTIIADSLHHMTACITFHMAKVGSSKSWGVN